MDRDYSEDREEWECGGKGGHSREKGLRQGGQGVHGGHERHEGQDGEGGQGKQGGQGGQS